MNARHRVSKMLLRHGRVYPKPSTWSQAHRRWLSRQQLPEPMSELTYADLVACVDGLSARKKALAERISQLTTEQRWWPIVARLRAFRVFVKGEAVGLDARMLSRASREWPCSASVDYRRARDW